MTRHRLSASLAAALTLGTTQVIAAGTPSASAAFVTSNDRATDAAAAQAVVPYHFVSNCNDAGPGSLRGVLTVAPSGSTIAFAVTCSSITLTSGEIAVPASVSIIGPGQSKLAIDGGRHGRIFRFQENADLSGLTLRNGDTNGNGGCIDSAADVFLTDVHLTGCVAHGASSSGGGVNAYHSVYLGDSTVDNNAANATSGVAYGGGVASRTVAATNTTIANNTASSTSRGSYGGGLFAAFQLQVDRSTLSGNVADTGGAIGTRVYASHSGDANLLIDQSTVSGNVARRSVAGILADNDLILLASTVAFNCVQQPDRSAAAGVAANGSQAAIFSSIVANNTVCGGGRGSAFDVSSAASTPIVGDHNLIGSASVTLPADTISADPKLAALASNGGTTRTHALMAGSPALNAGEASGRGYDQRGLGSARVVGSASDIGAFEQQSTGVARAVLNCNDGGAGSLRNAIETSQSGDTINLQALSCTRISLTSGELAVHEPNLRIVGPSSGALTIDANGRSAVIHHDGVGTLELQSLKLSGGHGSQRGGCVNSDYGVHLNHVTIQGCDLAAGHYGAGVYARNALIENSVISGNHCPTFDAAGCRGGGVFARYLTLNHSSVADNTATRAGGFMADDATLISSTIARNVATSSTDGAGYASGKLTVSNSTVAENSAAVSYGGVRSDILDVASSTIDGNMATTGDAFSGALSGIHLLHIESTIACNNFSGSFRVDVGGQFGRVFGTHNLLCGAFPFVLPADTLKNDPLLGALRDNGGGIETEALSPASPAIDAGINRIGVASDERGVGFPRQFGTAPDIGAFEFEGNASSAP